MRRIPRTKLPAYFDRLAWTGTGLLAMASLPGFLGGLHWLPDLFAHFRVQYLQLALLLAGICLWVRRNRCAAALVAVAAFNYAFILPLYMGKPPPPTGKPMRAMLMNLNAANGKVQSVLKSIRTADPDVLLLEEVTPDWAFELSVLAGNFPYRVSEPQEGCFGIMLLAKHPMERGRIVEIGDAGVPSIIADLHLPHGTVSIVGTHPVPPIGAAYARNRNLQLAALPAVTKAQQHPVLLMGDLNTTPWSPHFAKLIQESGLHNSMKGFGFQPTWPANLPFMRIPLDHVLYSDGIVVHNRMVGGNVGSDHFPVVVDFSIR